MDCKEFTCMLFCIIWIACCFIPSSEASYEDNLYSDSLIIVKETNDTIPSRMAAFGPTIGEGIQGIVVPMHKLVNDTNNIEVLKSGCRVATDDEIKRIYDNNSKAEEDGFIALVERGGNCTFSDKVRNMQNSGAKAVIVGNNRGEIHLVTMYAGGDTSDIRIPSVFILQYDMNLLIQNYSYEDISIIESDSDWPLGDIVIMTILLPIIFIFGIFVIYKFRVETLEAELHNGSSTSIGAATQEEVDALPIKVFSMEKKKENDPETCAVCIDDFVDGDKLRVLPCHHEYHVECIDLWLTTRKSFCPICKRCINGDDDADENTPLLGNSSNNNNYNTDGSSSSSSSSNHIIDIELEENGEDSQQQSIDQNCPTQQEEELIQPSDDEDDSNENEPLINLVNRS